MLESFLRSPLFLNLATIWKSLQDLRSFRVPSHVFSIVDTRLSKILNPRRKISRLVSTSDSKDKKSFTNFDKYEWIKRYGVWSIEVTKDDGEKNILPEGVIPARAPSRYDEAPDYNKWKKSMEKKKIDSGPDVTAR